ncbi:dnaJ homolog subfamily C member 7 [Schistocerca americana]|uniref:dnaJ homolog subfamily C member 7 n=1 Tax=Schistocerca americana TaxID=7009 RepID=UPI001F4FA0FD|nr:dnaJ homolog subfamily C member 7 [Schistocerca americana]XP_047116649.1 dnaJ homolog subfamily C member 7 [Schistocerca piceifrons]XP_049959860.1 dnaJ homolog subfamily C member 7 [Schistocerca serialis cubense]
MADTLIDLEMAPTESAPEIVDHNEEELAEIKKETGNQLYKTKKYIQAIPYYTEAIELCPDSPSYYGNRSACYMMLHQYKEALEDARKSVLLDPRFVKGYIRIAKCSLALGDITAAENAISFVKELEPANTAILPEIKKIEVVRRFEEEAKKAYLKNDYRKVVYCMDRMLEQVPCSLYKLQRAECLALIGRYQEAQEVANDILHFDKQNADAIYVRGMCLYYQDNVEKAFSHFQHVLKLAPDHTKAMDIYKKAKLLKQKKEEGNEAFKSNKLAEAYALYTEALKIDPYNNSTNAKLYFNRATVCSKLGRLNESVADCTAALSLDPNYLKALLRRAKNYMELGEYEDAVRDYENVCKMDKSRENRRLLQEAKLALKKSKRKDYYKILGIDKNASTDEIKKAYRKRALVHHPDRHASASSDEKKEQEKKFKEVGEAYGILSDPKKRARYDNGQDLEDLEGMGSEVDPSTVFQAFFGDQYSFGNGGFTFQFG